MQAANQTLLDQVHRARQAQALIVDLDSSNTDTYGEQEEAAYSAHYQTVGVHPLVAFDGLTGDFLKAKLRPGNVYMSSSFHIGLRAAACLPDGSISKNSLSVRLPSIL